MALPYISRGDRRNEAEEHALSLLRVFGLTILPPNSSVTCPVAKLSG